MTIEVIDRRSAPDTRRILEALPDWFGDPVAIDNYVAAAADPDFGSVLAVRPESVVGVALTRRHFAQAAEIHLIAVDPEHRGSGVGRALVEHIVEASEHDGCSLLSVHTVGPSFEHEPYAQTRAFYRAVGFLPLEEHDGLDWSGPSLILVRPLAGAAGPDRAPDPRVRS